MAAIHPALFHHRTRRRRTRVRDRREEQHRAAQQHADDAMPHGNNQSTTRPGRGNVPMRSMQIVDCRCITSTVRRGLRSGEAVALFAAAVSNASASSTARTFAAHRPLVCVGAPASAFAAGAWRQHLCLTAPFSIDSTPSSLTKASRFEDVRYRWFSLRLNRSAEGRCSGQEHWATSVWRWRC